jgi:hypothetical protein
MIGNGSLNGIRAVNLATSKNLIAKSTMPPHCKSIKYAFSSPDGKTHKHTGHVSIDKNIVFK